MVARTPPKQRRFMGAHHHPPPLNPLLIRETVNKVDKCMARLQELQYTVAGGNKVVASGVSLSPRSTRGYLRTSLRCKQESLRIKSSAARKSPTGKLPVTATGEWKRMSLPAMLLGETMGEILKASQFAKELVAAVNPPPAVHQEDPKTPLPQQRKKPPPPPNSQNDTVLKSKRHKEKQHQNKLNSIRSESGSPSPSIHRRARYRSINFKVISPPRKRSDRENSTTTTTKTHHLANRVSPRNNPWGKKTVLFPNPLFHSSDNAAATTRSRSPPIFSRTHQKKAAPTTPHKFLIKSPVKISPTKDRAGGKKKAAAAPSPTKFSATATKLRRSFSPSRIANRLVSLSPLKGGRRNNGSGGSSNVQRDGGGGGDGSMMVNSKVSGLKQRPQMMVASSFSPRRFSLGRI